MKYENIRIELLDMAKEDQRIRKIALETGLLDQTIDIKNTTRVKGIVEEFGWPTSKMVGEDASQAAWLLVQHADLDPSFQNKCLLLMQDCYKTEPNQQLSEQIKKLTERVNNPII